MSSVISVPLCETIYREKHEKQSSRRTPRDVTPLTDPCMRNLRTRLLTHRFVVVSAVDINVDMRFSQRKHLQEVVKPIPSVTFLLASLI